mmetsp:Transcript_22711/g.43323  ORF Transcript_22711/g.43323 Transcript_22711/m.43323 type:complete len:105 (-) Transcript_22711:300-614(-)
MRWRLKQQHRIIVSEPSRHSSKAGLFRRLNPSLQHKVEYDPSNSRKPEAVLEINQRNPDHRHDCRSLHRLGNQCIDSPKGRLRRSRSGICSDPVASAGGSSCRR